MNDRTLSGAEYNVWHKVFDLLRGGLAEEQEHRARRRSLGPDGVPRWIEHERRYMFELVNAERARRGLPAVTMDAIRACEDRACGHIDYTKKFALGCADLVFAEYVEPSR